MLALFLSLLILSPFFPRECSSEALPPAMYVFGDSLLDAGNNNRISDSLFAKANYRPYGINFRFPGPNPRSSGRFTDGKTFVDFIAGYLGLPFPLAYRGTPRSTTGYTYASGGCGILNETGKGLGCMSLDVQVGKFQETIDEELVPRFGNPAELSQHLANSLFIIWAGSNDYLLNYFHNQTISPDEFADVLIDHLSLKLERLHGLGARKFVVLDMAPLGCVPVYRKNGGHDEEWCDEDKNMNAMMFNQRLTLMLQTLASTYPDSYFTRGNTYLISDHAFKNPAIYGFKNVSSSCCATNNLTKNIPCTITWPSWSACEKPEEYLFWDGAHPTQASFEILATPCFSGSGVCVPYNIQQLALLQTTAASLHSAA